MLVEFRSRLIAASDHPVVPWSLADRARRPAAEPLTAGLMNTLEVRMPVSPTLLLLMTWADEGDERVPGCRDHAANANAFTIAQAAEQWFHYPGARPPITSGALLPLSTQLKPGYRAEC